MFCCTTVWFISVIVSLFLFCRLSWQKEWAFTFTSWIWVLSCFFRLWWFCTSIHSLVSEISILKSVAKCHTFKKLLSAQVFRQWSYWVGFVNLGRLEWDLNIMRTCVVSRKAGVFIFLVFSLSLQCSHRSRSGCTRSFFSSWSPTSWWTAGAETSSGDTRRSLAGVDSRATYTVSLRLVRYFCPIWAQCEPFSRLSVSNKNKARDFLRLRWQSFVASTLTCVRNFFQSRMCWQKGMSRRMAIGFLSSIIQTTFIWLVRSSASGFRMIVFWQHRLCDTSCQK